MKDSFLQMWHQMGGANNTLLWAYPTIIQNRNNGSGAECATAVAFGLKLKIHFFKLTENE